MKHSSTFWLTAFFLALLGSVAAPGAIAQDAAPRLTQIEARLAQLEARVANLEVVQSQHGGAATTHPADPQAPAPGGGAAGGGMGSMGHM